MDSASLIVIDARRSKTKQRVTFVHEEVACHPYQFCGQVSQEKMLMLLKSGKHDFIGTYEEASLIVLKDNPEVAKYLTA